MTAPLALASRLLPPLLLLAPPFALLLAMHVAARALALCALLLHAPLQN